MRSHCRHVAVLIPARNEEALLRRCLESVLVAGCNLPSKVTFDVVVAVDSSTDRTQAIAEELLCGMGKVICVRARSVGSARAAAATVALKRYRGALNRCWLANTDADCQVPPSWLRNQIAMANKGAEAIAGTVDVDSFEEHDAGVEERFRNSYLIFPDGSHPHIHGANLGVRADAYLRAGGWAQQTTAEDHDLWERLRLAGSRRISVASIRVSTSGRRIGRAPSGFAGALAAHNVVAA
jgi:glycosyltransferase involved in cell wall biosynthesis